MTIKFPKIKPSELRFTPAVYNVVTPKFRDIMVAPRLLANRPNSPTLFIAFRCISANDILSIFHVWELSYSGFLGIDLPSEITSSIISSNFASRIINPELIVWRFSSEPTLSNVTAGVGDVSIQLKGDPSSVLDLPPSWVLQLTSPPNNQPIPYDSVNCIADNKGNVYVGTIMQNTSGSIKWVNITKYSASGSLRWSKDINQNIGFGNSIKNDSITPFFNLVSGSVIITSLYAVTGTPNSAQNHKIICLSSIDGTLKWAKSVGVAPSKASHSQYGLGIYTNDITGHIYIVFNYLSDSEVFYVGLLTLDSYGNTTACKIINNPGTALDLNTITGIETKPDSSIIVYGVNGTGTYAGINRRGFTFEMNSTGTFMTVPLRLYGSQSDQIDFRSAALLSTGLLVAIDALTPRFHVFDSSNGNYQSCIIPAKNLGTQVLQIKEREDGTVAVLGWAASVSTVNTWGENTPSNARVYVGVYSSDMSQLIKYKVADVGSDSFSSRDHARIVKGCVPSLDRYIAVPGVYAIISMDLSSTYERYATLPSYLTLGNTFAKFASETAQLPINTSVSTPKIVTTTDCSAIALDSWTSDYSSSIVITDATPQWSYFSA